MQNRMKYWSVYNMEEPWNHYGKYKRPLTKDHILYILGEMSRLGKFMETESKLVVGRGWEKGEQGATIHGYGDSFWGDENVPELR